MGDGSVIASRSNPLVKKLRMLRQARGRRESRLFLVEGIHAVGEVIEAGWEVEALVYAPDLLTSDYARQLVLQQSSQGIRCQPLSPDVFKFISEKDNPQGIMAAVHWRNQGLDKVNGRTLKWGVAVVSPQDPGNVGTILRTMDSVGADGLFMLDGGVDLYHPTAVRASMGTLFWIPILEMDFDRFLVWVREGGYHLVGSSAHAEMDYHQIRGMNERAILMLGNEQKGLSPEQLQACEVVVSLPMVGRSSSLNLAVAAGILLYTMGEKAV